MIELQQRNQYGSKEGEKNETIREALVPKKGKRVESRTACKQAICFKTSNLQMGSRNGGSRNRKNKKQKE